MDRALERRVREEFDAIREGDVDIDFGPPSCDRDLGGSGRPTVNLYLYDVREDLDHRQNGTVVHRDQLLTRSDGKQILVKSAEHDPPRYARLSYLLTTWAADAPSSHHMLGVLLVGLVRDSALPLRLDPDLELLGVSATMEVGSPPAGDLSTGELWGALNQVLVPSLNITVSVPLLTFVPEGIDHRVLQPAVLRFRVKRLEDRAPRQEQERTVTGGE
ncbi:Pvc16 family protein [Streptomyces cinnamoneus]|uniref:Pvc16 family protein n=1 Tax=Streptomyces cinnamoneus TaxID=53446 RepID=UPI00340C210C